MLLSTSCCSTAPAASSLAPVTSDIFALGAGNVNAIKFTKQSFEASKTFLIQKFILSLSVNSACLLSCRTMVPICGTSLE